MTDCHYDEGVNAGAQAVVELIQQELAKHLKPGEGFVRLVLFRDRLSLLRLDDPSILRCRAATRKGKPCRHIVGKEFERCEMHKGQGGVLSEQEIGR